MYNIKLDRKIILRGVYKNMYNIEIGSSYYYNGVGIENWKNQVVRVISNINENVGTKRDVPVYLCELDGEKHKIMAVNLSKSPISYNYKNGGMKECFPENVERFPTFKNGRYTLEYTWGKY